MLLGVLAWGLNMPSSELNFHNKTKPWMIQSLLILFLIFTSFFLFFFFFNMATEQVVGVEETRGLNSKCH
jgi:hypothetical protein